MKLTICTHVDVYMYIRTYVRTYIIPQIFKGEHLHTLWTSNKQKVFPTNFNTQYLFLFILSNQQKHSQYFI